MNFISSQDALNPLQKAQSQESHGNSGQIDMIFENLQLRQEIDRLQSLILSYQEKENMVSSQNDQLQSKVDNQNQHEVIQYKGVIEKLSQNPNGQPFQQISSINSTFVIYNQIPSFTLADPRSNQSMFDQSLISREDNSVSNESYQNKALNTEYNSKNLLKFDDLSEIRNPQQSLALTQQYPSKCPNDFQMNDIFISNDDNKDQDIKKSENQFGSPQGIPPSNEDNHKQDYEGKTLEELEQDLAKVIEQERELLELIKVNTHEMQESRKYLLVIDDDQNTKEHEEYKKRLQESEKAMHQIRLMCSELQTRKQELNQMKVRVRQNQDLRDQVLKSICTNYNISDKNTRSVERKRQASICIQFKVQSPKSQDKRQGIEMKVRNDSKNREIIMVQQNFNPIAKLMLRSKSSHNQRMQEAQSVKRIIKEQRVKNALPQNHNYSQANQKSIQILKSQSQARKVFQNSKVLQAAAAMQAQQLISKKSIINENNPDVKKTQQKKTNSQSQNGLIKKTESISVLRPHLQFASKLVDLSQSHFLKRKTTKDDGFSENMNPLTTLNQNPLFSKTMKQSAHHQRQYTHLQTSNLFNCGDSDDLSRTEKSLLEDFKNFLQQQQEKKQHNSNQKQTSQAINIESVDLEGTQKDRQKYEGSQNESKQIYEELRVKIKTQNLHIEQPAVNLIQLSPDGLILNQNQSIGLKSDNSHPRSNTAYKRSQQSMKHCLNCAQLLSRGLSTAFCKEHQYARSKMII